MEGFTFGTPSIEKYLTGKLAPLKQYNGLSIPAEYFEAAMSKLRNDRLSIALDTVLHPISTAVLKQVKKQQVAAGEAPNIKEGALTAQEWFEKGYNSNNAEDKVYYYTQAIQLKSDYADAYYNRGVARGKQGDQTGAIIDYTEAIRIQPDDAQAYYGRGVSRNSQGDYTGAIIDYTEAIRIKPDYADAYYGRGLSEKKRGNITAAIKDYNEAILIEPNHAQAYNNRAVIHSDQGNVNGAIKDYTEAIRSKPDYANAYYNRAINHIRNADTVEAIADYQKYLDLGGGLQYGDQAEVEKTIQDLKSKL